MRLDKEKVTKMHSDLLFKWANDSEVRKQSFHSETIKYDDHVLWFTNTLNDKNTHIYICYIDKIPVGMLRLIINGNTATISYSVAAEFRGKGIGKKIIDMAEDISRQIPNIRYLIGHVKAENIASRHIFMKSGFKEKFINEQRYLYKKDLDNTKNRGAL